MACGRKCFVESFIIMLKFDPKKLDLTDHESLECNFKQFKIVLD